MTLYLGIDIGGTNTVLGLVGEGGEILSSQTLSTKRYGADYRAYIAALTEHIQQLIASTPHRGAISGIGVGAPNANHYSGCIEKAVNLPWSSSVPLVADLSASTGLPVILDNDANVSALGEHSYGVARDWDDFIEITLGTGVGSGIYADGHLVRGNHGKAGELGHVAVGEPGELCGCGHYGCLEASVSAPAVSRRARRLIDACIKRGGKTVLSEIPNEKLTSKTGQILGRALAQFACFSAPQAFVLFGGLAQCGGLLLDPVQRAFSDSLLDIYKDTIEICLSSLPMGYAAVLGAASLVREHQEKS